MDINLIEEQKNLYTGEHGEELIYYKGSEYISDAFSEIAENSINIYTKDLFDWAYEHTDLCDRVKEEFCIESREITFTDFVEKVAQAAQQMYFYEDMLENEKDIIKYYAYNILIKMGHEEISEENFDRLNELLEELDANSRCEDIPEAVYEITGKEN